MGKRHASREEVNAPASRDAVCESPDSSYRPAVFLDRDGTLNRQVIRDGVPYPPATIGEFELFPGVPEVCAQLAAAGYVLVVATNQPDVGRGTQPQSVVEAMHAKLRQLVPSISHIEVCYAPGRPGDPPDPRRKPEPGMLLESSLLLGLDLQPRRQHHGRLLRRPPRPLHELRHCVAGGHGRGGGVHLVGTYLYVRTYHVYVTLDSKHTPVRTIGWPVTALDPTIPGRKS